MRILALRVPLTSGVVDRPEGVNGPPSMFVNFGREVPIGRADVARDSTSSVLKVQLPMRFRHSSTVVIFARLRGAANARKRMQIDRAVEILFAISPVIPDRHGRHLANHPMIIVAWRGRVARRTYGDPKRPHPNIVYSIFSEHLQRVQWILKYFAEIAWSISPIRVESHGIQYFSINFSYISQEELRFTLKWSRWHFTSEITWNSI